ncbi:medium-chain fatty acid-CoA ligase faa2 [Kickxella alabastrina]|uniref:Medium-chain fatty acid-CoA ligase faa2 n=1 Tax=Kickxella alabastrina TaxID=61397 RepID=A0ACC1II51_9FUNG|nr:medium-chain fatty acid-CoA ligase faa2 [Kickxella alabastrina]
MTTYNSRSSVNSTLSTSSASTKLCGIELPGAPSIPGETKPYINHIITDGKLITHINGINSMYDNFLRGRSIAGRNSPIFGTRPVIDGMGNVGGYRWVTWDLFHERFINFASGLRKLGLQQGETIGIFLANSIEWVLTEQASYYHRIVSVPLYDSLSQSALTHVITEAEISVVVCTSSNARLLLEMSESIPFLQALIVVDTFGSDLVQMGETRGISVRLFRQVEDSGAKQAVEPEALPGPQDIATIVYTSGTVGIPKGVVLTHANMLATIAATTAMSQEGDMYKFTPKDCSIGFLPLAHCLGRMVLHMMISFGVKTAFPRNNPATLVEDLRDLQPTIFVGVPRIFSRIQDRVLSTVKVKGGLPSALFHYAYSTKKNNLIRGQVNHWLWDRVIFKPLREKFGGKLKLIVSGSAPISPETLEFLRCCFSCSVIEGYGLSETMGPSSVTLTDDIEPGNVGAPIPCVMAKLRSVPNLGYNVEDMPSPRGEILVKGANVASEYLKQPEKTRDAFIDDGWLCTGDIGTVDERGRFHIIDRKNNLFKLAQGEFIAPEKIENVCMDHFVVEQAYIYGDPLKNALVAVVVPDKGLLISFLKSKGTVPTVDKLSFEDLCQDLRVRRAVIDELAVWGKAHDLCGFEIPKNIFLHPVSFEKLDLLTPTFKLKRQDAKAHFDVILSKLYVDMA